MGIKVIVLYCAILGSIPFALLRPHVGVMAYYWFTFMNPHMLTYGVTLAVPWGKLIAVTAMLSWLTAGSFRHIPTNAIFYLLLGFFFWTFITTFDATFPDWAWVGLIEFGKAVIMAILCMSVVNTRVRLHAMIWIMVISVGFHGVEAGLRILIAGGGGYVVDGPRDSQYKDTNEFALWLLMLLPWVGYLYLHSAKRITRLAMIGTGLMLILAIIGTDSRGGALGMACVAATYWIFSRHRTMVAIAGIALVGVGLLVLSQERIDRWTGRVETIQTYEEDPSAQTRLWVWGWAMERARDEFITGEGFGGFRGAIYPGTPYWRAAHSNYFAVLGEHGWVGLTLFVLLLVTAVWRAVHTYRRCRGRPDLYWARDFGFMATLSLVAYATAGAFLSTSYDEIYYIIIAMIAGVDAMVARQLSEEAKAARRQVDLQAQPGFAGRQVPPVFPVRRHDQ